MAKLERTYNVPLRKGFRYTPGYKKAKKATRTLREFMQRHMKSEEIRIGQQLNQHIWKHGVKNPPHHVTVTAVKDDDGVVRVELEGVKYVEAVQPEEQAPDKGLAGKLAEKVAGKTDADKKADEKAKADEKESKTKTKTTDDKTKETAKKTDKKETKQADKKTSTKPRKSKPAARTTTKKTPAKKPTTKSKKS